MDFLNKLKERLGIIKDLEHAAAVMDWDQQTYMPEKASSARAQQLSTLHKLAHEFFIDDETGRLLDMVEKDINNLGENDKALVTLARKEFEKQRRVPSRLIEELSKISSEAINVWVEARQKDDFSLFQGYLEKIVRLSREIAEAIGYQEHPYDALLDQYEPEMTSAKVTQIFELLAEELKKLVKDYSPLGQHETRFDGPFYPKDKQLELSRKIAELIGFDFSRGRIDLSAHPFTTSFTPLDVRLTTRVDESNFRPALFGTIHEAGHGIYEQHLPQEFARTPLGDAASLGFHESQSRFFENIIGRSATFWTLIYPEWKEFFPEAGQKGNLHDLVKYINSVKPSLIRVEADEVTYNLHIVIRFLLEKDLIAGDLSVEKAPSRWNELYEEYLGIAPDSNANGILQDIHWSAALFGYFPTYTIGNLISAQLKESIESELDTIENLITHQKFAQIVDWFDKKIYQHGKKYTPEVLVKKATGKDLSAEPFLKYLKGKYGELVK